MDIEKGNPLFEFCVFAIITSKELPEKRAVELQRTLEDHAGRVEEIKPDGIVRLEEVTHIISSTTDFPQYSTARLQMISVITPAWITQSLLKNKQAQIRPFSPDPKLFFSNVTLSCADIPRGDKDAIIGAVLAMGGMESSSVTKMTTHICALTMDHPKCQKALVTNPKCKIVLPHWFDDCLKLGKRINERPYLLPDPEIFRVKPEENIAMPATGRIDGAISPRPEFLPTPTESPSLRRLDVFDKKRVMISQDLGIGNRLRLIIENLIEGGGGTITTSVHKADIYICHFREGRDYVFASRAGIDVGNLSWLYHLVAHNAWTSPLRRLLHYPIPRNGIPGFQDFRITLSNYGGEARVYLENLVVAAGGEFTKSMREDNTHLITARKSSEKCTAAEEWNINMINHLWIEESYARCEVQRLTDPRYTHFPPRTNLGEVIGQTQLEDSVLRTLYFPRDPTPSPNDPKALRRPVMHEKDRNMTSPRVSHDDGFMAHSDLVDSAPSREAEGNDPTNNKKAFTVPALPRPRSRAAVTLATTPYSIRRTSNGKENDTPSSTNSRSAKDQALSKLHDLAPDVALYEKEKKRKGHVWGGDRAANQIEKQKALQRSSSPTNNEDMDSFDDDDPNPKRIRTGLPPVEIRLLITGYRAWLNNINKEDAEKKKLRELGILVVQDPTNCTHLAAPAMVRTQKFLCALASGPRIVSSSFIDTCIEKNEIPPVENFLLKDLDNEKRFKLKLREVVVRAKANKRQLLRHVPIYCTAEISNGPDTYKSIVEANGGMFSIYRARGGSTIKQTNPEDDEGEPEPVYLITGPRPEERKLWPKFEQMAKAGNMKPRIVNPEWLLDVAMSQQLKWGEKYLAVKD